MNVDELLEMERAVWDALVAGDSAADSALLSEDFLGVYPSGFADRDGHAGQLNDGPTVATYELHDARIVVVSDDAVLLTYRADYRRPAASGNESASMYVSSLWCRREDRWLNVFSQDTPTGPSVP
jgi:hypothetical protein